MSRYVILHHKTPDGYQRPDHWDFMLQWGDALRTWAVQQEPRTGLTDHAESLDDHRLEFLDFEGQLSGGRGYVQRWDSGTYELCRESENELVIRLLGRRLQCNVTLVNDSPEPHWTISFSSD